MRVNATANDISFTDINRRGIKTILVPTDLSESSDIALQIAIDLAKQQNAKIHLLHVQRFQRSGNKIEMMERQRAKFPEAKSVKMALEVRQGRIYNKILDAQIEMNADLIVIARHGKKGLLHTFFPSVTEKVKKKATCSVLVIGV